MCLLITSPAYANAERTYILDTIFNDFLGLPYQHQLHENAHTSIKILETGFSLNLPDDFFYHVSQQGYTPSLLPETPLKIFSTKNIDFLQHLNQKTTPILYGNILNNNEVIDIRHEHIACGLDILGSIFFMLTSLEEYLNPARNANDQFPVQSSVLFQEKFYRRPLVNEYVEILFALLQKLGLSAPRKQWQYALNITHDVDRPFSIYKQPLRKIIRNSLGDILYRRDFRLPLKRIICIPLIKLGLYKLDPNYTFNFMMKVSEKHKLTSKFYFITQHTHPKYDTFYTVHSRALKHLLIDIDRRGHEIGIHGNYNSFDSENEFEYQVQLLNQLCTNLQIKQQAQGGRPHYLHCKNPLTWRLYEKAGLTYTSSSAFSEDSGFKTGTCYPYRLFDIEEKRPLNLTEYPLIMMDTSLFKKNLSISNDAIESIETLAKQCKLYNGVFTLLWHNHLLITRRQKFIYQKIIAKISADS